MSIPVHLAQPAADIRRGIAQLHNEAIACRENWRALEDLFQAAEQLRDELDAVAVDASRHVDRLMEQES